MRDENISIKQGNRIRQKSSWFVGTTHYPLDMISISNNIKEFKFYAYIFHDKDIDKSRHIHFVINCSGSRTIKSVCDTLSCDYIDVQKCKTPRGAIRYLVHLDNSDKYQYKYEDIVTNNADRLAFYFDKNQTSDILELAKDFNNVKTGLLSRSEFLEKYRAEFANMPFYQKVKTLECLNKLMF